MLEAGVLVSYHNAMLGSNSNPNYQYMCYMHKGCALFNTSLGLILGINLTGSVELSHIHHRIFFVGGLVGSCETCLRNIAWTHS